MDEQLAKSIYLYVERRRKEDVLGVMAELEESQWFSCDQLMELQWERFKNIIQWAYDKTEYYKEKFRKAGIEPGDIKSRDDLRAIPVLTKDDIKENFNTIQPGNGEAIDIVSTSGSMAEPLMVVRDRETQAHHKANMFRFRKWYGVDIGAYEATFRGTNFPWKDLIKLRFRDFMINRCRLHERNLSSHNMEKYYRKMLKQQPKTFYGFPTLIDRFTEYLQEKGVGSKPFKELKCIISTSEMSSSGQKKRWSEYYEVPAVDEYGCTEAGILAMECPEGGWHVPVESCLVEHIPLENELGIDGAHTLVVTDLWNSAMPIIRYEVGDSAMPGDCECTCGRGLPTMKAFEGRIAKLIDLPDGRTIHSLDFYYIFRKAGEITPDGIKEFQVRIFTPKIFQIDIVPGPEFNGEVMDFLSKKIGFALGKEAQIEYKLLNRIERTGTGKFEKVIIMNKDDIHSK